MVCNRIVDIIGISSFSGTANLMVRTETKIGNKTGNKFETELQKGNLGEYLPGYVNVMQLN